MRVGQRAVLGLSAAALGLSLAAPAPADPAECRRERLALAKAACLRAAADLLADRGAVAIERFGLEVQAADAALAAAYLRTARAGQARWARRTVARCRDRAEGSAEPALSDARCRLAAAERRTAVIEARIAAAAIRLGLADAYGGYPLSLEITPGPGGRFEVSPEIHLPAPR